MSKFTIAEFQRLPVLNVLLFNSQQIHSTYKSPASAGITSFKRYPLSVKQSGEGFAGGMEIFSSYKIKAIRDAPSRGLLVSLSLLSFFFFSRLFYFSHRFLFFLHIATKGSSWRKMLSQRNSASLQNAFKCRAFIPPRLQMHLRKRTRLRMRFIRQLLICKAVDDAIVDGEKRASERASGACESTRSNDKTERA